MFVQIPPTGKPSRYLRVPASARFFLLLTPLLLAPLLLYLYLSPFPSLESLATRQPAPASRILDRNSLLLYEIIDPAGGSYQPVPLAAVPRACIEATIATEDSRFYRHPGVDLIAIARAAWANLQGEGVIQGGSTLTQQLARILLLEERERYEQSLRRKLREALLAWRLERRYSKDELLALYLNNVYYGHYANGIEAAAHAYFNRPAADLDLAQCALLAGLPQFPAGYNPIENPEAARRRQSQVLALMVEAGYLSPEAAERTGAEPLHYAASPFPIQAPHFVFYVQSQLEATLGESLLARGGLTIHTTLDLPLQQEAETIMRRRLAELNRPSPDLPLQRRANNAALVLLDPASGELLALVGSPDYFDARIAGAVNGALALRQPGSALKPVTYAAALDPALSEVAGRQPLTAASILADVPSSFPTREGLAYRPLNYDLAFHGPVPVRAALAQSLNIPAVRVLQRIGIDTLVAQAREHGITSFGSPGDYGLALTLGGGEVRLLELTAAYAPFANAGRPLSFFAISRIQDANGEVLFDAGLNGPATNTGGWDLPAHQTLAAVLDPRTAYLIADILSDNDARAPAFGFSSPLRLPDGRPVAAKTGTTTDWRDNWTIGFTPDLLAGVWVGNADNTPMYGASGVDGAAPIWHDVMSLAHKTLPPRPFTRPKGLVELDVCVSSGLLAAPNCPQVARELFIAGTEPSRPDDQHRRIAIDTRTGRPAGADTPDTALGSRIAWEPPPVLRDWARTQGMLLWEPAGPAVSGGGETPSLTLYDPQPGAVYLLDPRLPGESQQLRLAVEYGDAPALNRVQYWIDGEAVAESQSWPWLAWWPLQPGAHTVQAIAHTDAGVAISTPVVAFTVR